MFNRVNKGDFSTHTHTHTQLSFEKHSCAGRTLMEMLGTLAVMGIITVIGVKLFHSAMNQHYANEVINEAQKRAVSVAAQIVAGKDKNALSLAEFPNTDKYTFGVEAHPTNPNRFNITVDAVELDACKRMKTMIGPYTALRALSSDCTTLTFNDDLSREADASDYNLSQVRCTAAGYKWCSMGDNGIQNKCFEDKSTNCCSHANYDTQCQQCDTGGYVSNLSDSTPCDFDGDGVNDSTCQSGVCPKPGITSNTTCTSNADCGGTGSGWFCQIYYDKDINLNGSMNNTNTNCYKNLTGKCAVVKDKARISSEKWAILTQAGFSATFLKGQPLNWWSAKNWCLAQGKQLIDVAQIGCYHGNTLLQNGGSGSSCCKAPGNGCSPTKWQTSIWNGNSVVPGQAEEVAKFSDKLVALRKVFGAVSFWSSSNYGIGTEGSCYAFYIGAQNGYATSNGREPARAPICQ